jgi:LysM repeat protein
MNRYSRIVQLFVVALLVSSALLVSGQQTANAATCAQLHVVQRGENLYRLALRYNTTIATIQLINGMAAETRIYVGQRLCMKLDYGGNQPGGTKYVVARGDTLLSIARRYGVDMRVLAKVNNIVNPNRIYVGQVLYIPDVTIQ